MHWWDELSEQWKEEPAGLPYALVALAAVVALSSIPVVVIEVGMSFIVPVERWFAVVLMLVVWPVQWRTVVGLGAAFELRPAAALIIGGFVVRVLLGPLAGIVVISTASSIAFWVIGKLEARNQAAFRAIFGDTDVRPPRRPTPP